MADVKLIRTQNASNNNGNLVTKLDFVVPNHALVLAINREALEMYPCPGVFYGGGYIPLEAIAVNPDGRILEGRPKPQFNGCCSPIVYEGSRQGESYRLSFFPITAVEIQTKKGVNHQPVIDEMVAVMEEAYKLKE